MTSPTDGYTNVTQRDTRGMTGGTVGHVNTAQTVFSYAGKDIKAFEWALLAKLDNYADAGENVALYAQGNKHGTGPTWGACIEACDTTPGDATGLVGLEVDAWVSGPDNGLRFGVDVVVGDAQFIRKGIKGEAFATYGTRIAACGTTPWAKWGYGIHITDYIHAGIHLRSDATRGIHIQGKHIVTLDLSESEDQTTIRMKAGQKICFDQYDSIALQLHNGRLSLTNRHIATPIFEIDTTTGDIYKLGKKVL